jgi:hypothetical protein
MAKKDVGQGAVLGFEWASKLENAVGRGRNADDRNEVSKQDDPKY